MRLRDLTGQKFGRLTVLERGDSLGRVGVYWKCKCECGNECTVHGNAIVRGHTKSCGCLAVETSKNAKSHGLSSTKEYKIWKAMRRRCYGKNTENYHRYGGRGVRVCEEWSEFSNFYKWCGENGYKEGLTIDRIDNDGDYCPENCRWVDKITQGNNKSNNRRILYKGEELTLMQIERRTGIDHRTIGKRLDAGWTVEQSTEIAPRYGNRIVAKRKL